MAGAGPLEKVKIDIVCFDIEALQCFSPCLVQVSLAAAVKVMEEGVDQRPPECCDIEPKGDIGGEAAIEDRKVWADERLRGGKATGKYVLKWKNGSGEELRYRCIIGYNRWGENVGRVFNSIGSFDVSVERVLA